MFVRGIIGKLKRDYKIMGIKQIIKNIKCLFNKPINNKNKPTLSLDTPKIIKLPDTPRAPRTLSKFFVKSEI